MAQPAAPAPAGPGARALLVWMQTNPSRLRALLAEEATQGAGDDLGPSGDPSIRAHLRFVAEALAANAAPATRDAAQAFAASAGDRLRDSELLAEEIEMVGEAHAFEVSRQFGIDAGEDPAMRSVIERRVRMSAWMRVFLREVDRACALPSEVAPAAIEWMAGNQTRLADTIFAMDRAAKQAELERGGPDAIAATDVVNRIGQAATVQAHTRFLVEALSRA
ncbi:MAG: hypothetical protein ACLGG9_02540 [Thermoleophilia bacterium]